MRKVLAASAAGFMLAFGLVFTANSAMAGTDTVHNTAEGWSTFGTDATARVTENGIRITTPARVDRVRWDVPVSGNMQNLQVVRYRTFVHSDGDRGSAAPTVRINLDTDADGTADKTLMFEPYWNGSVKEGEWQTWDVVKVDSKLWDNDDSTQTVKTWLDWKAALQDRAVVKSVSISMGTWNEGADARVNNLRIVNNSGVAVHTWALTKVTPAAVSQEENVSDATCKAPGSLTLPEVTGVNYTRDPATGTGEVTVTAKAEPGYVLTDGNWKWTVTVPAQLPADSDKCKEPTTEPTTASPSPSQSTSNPGTGGGVTPSTSQTSEPAPSVSTSNAAGELPVTGSSRGMFLGLMGGGLLLISIGGSLLWYLRRRRDADEVSFTS